MATRLIRGPALKPKKQRAASSPFSPMRASGGPFPAYDEFDDEYENVSAPFSPATPSVTKAPVKTYTPPMDDYQFAPTPAMTGGGSAGFQPWRNIGRKTTTGLQDRWDPFGNQDPFGGGMVPSGQSLGASPTRFLQPGNILQDLSQFAEPVDPWKDPERGLLGGGEYGTVGAGANIITDLQRLAEQNRLGSALSGGMPFNQGIQSAAGPPAPLPAPVVPVPTTIPAITPSPVPEQEAVHPFTEVDIDRSRQAFQPFPGTSSIQERLRTDLGRGLGLTEESLLPEMIPDILSRSLLDPAATAGSQVPFGDETAQLVARLSEAGTSPFGPGLTPEEVAAQTELLATPLERARDIAFRDIQAQAARTGLTSADAPAQERLARMDEEMGRQFGQLAQQQVLADADLRRRSGELGLGRQELLRSLLGSERQRQAAQVQNLMQTAIGQQELTQRDILTLLGLAIQEDIEREKLKRAEATGMGGLVQSTAGKVLGPVGTAAGEVLGGVLGDVLGRIPGVETAAEKAARKQKEEEEKKKKGEPDKGSTATNLLSSLGSRLLDRYLPRRDDRSQTPSTFPSFRLPF